MSATPIRASQAKLEALRAAEHPHCLMCGAENPVGLKLKFRVQDERSVVAMFLCHEVLQSYPQTLHGGIISAVFDAAMVSALFSIGVVGVTADLTVRFLAPVSLNRGAVVRASIDDPEAYPLYALRSELEQDGKLMARASARFMAKGAT